jgi:hypothetical protein
MKRLIKFFTELFSKKQEKAVTHEPIYTPEEGVNVNYILESPERLQELMTYQADPTLRDYSKFNVTKETVLDSEPVKLKKAVSEAWDGICLSRVSGEAQIEMANIAKADIQRQIDINNKIQKGIFKANKK